MKEISWDYVAGLTDADGHISMKNGFLWKISNIDKEVIGSVFFFLKKEDVHPTVSCDDKSKRSYSFGEKIQWYVQTSKRSEVKKVLDNIVERLEHPEKKERGSKILNELEKIDFDTDPRKIQFSKNEKEEIINRYNNCETLSEIASDFDCSSDPISRRLEEWGVKRELTKRYAEKIKSNKEKISREYKSGKAVSEIASDFDVGIATLYEILREWNLKSISRQGRRIDFSEEEKRNIISKYKNGETFVSIAEDYPYSVTTIRNRLEDWGIHSSRQVNFSEKEKKEIIKRYELGQGIKSIAENFDCSSPTIRNRLEKWNIKLDSRRGRKKEEDLEAQLKFEEISDEF